MATKPQTHVDTFENPHPGRNYEIVFDCPEFTCLCPLTGQPDFAQFKIRYVPDKLCVELKSLKLYLWSYRDLGAFHEDVTNRIANHLIETLSPRSLTMEAVWNVRGGITTTVVVRHPNPEC